MVGFLTFLDAEKVVSSLAWVFPRVDPEENISA